MKHLFALLPLLAAPLLAPAAVTTVFDADFGNSTVFTTGTYPTPTATTTAFAIASSLNSSSSFSMTAGAFQYGAPSSGNAIVETQALFSPTAVALANTGDFIKMVGTFTVSNVLTTGTATASSQFTVGLLNSGGSAPLSTLANAGLQSANTTAATGGAKDWLGYNSRFFFTGGSAANSRARTLQPDANNRVQDAIFANASSSSAYSTSAAPNPSGTAAQQLGLTNGTNYTFEYTLTYDATTPSITISYNFYQGTDTSGTLLGSLTSTASTTTIVATAFDTLAIGYRATNSPAQVTNITFSALTLTTNVGAVPEPGEYAFAAGALALLAGLVLRRRARTHT